MRREHVDQAVATTVHEALDLVRDVDHRLTASVDSEVVSAHGCGGAYVGDGAADTGAWHSGYANEMEL